MKKHTKEYLVAWAVFLATYNVLAFLPVMFEIKLLPQYTYTLDARFWICWGSIHMMFLVHLICTLVAFSKGKDELFLSIPLIRKSYSTCIWMTIVGAACILLPDFPAWLAVILCILAFAPGIVRLAKTKTAGDLVAEAEKTVQTRTHFIISLTVDAQNLMDQATTSEIKAECKKVWEALRFSDPMSSEALAAAESRIFDKFEEFERAVTAGDLHAVQAGVSQLLAAVNDRNRKCKLLK